MEFIKKHRSLFQFFGWLLSGALVGLLFSFALNMLNENMDFITEQVEGWLALAVVPIEAVLFLLLVATSLGFYWVGRGKLLKATKSDEDLGELSRQGNRLVGLGLAAVNINTILIYGLSGVGAAVIPIKEAPLSFFLNLGILLLMMVYQTAYSVKVIAFIKQCSPEKKGDPLGVHFQKTWENSCDEAEKLATYRASYHTFLLLRNVILLLWVVTVCTGVLLGTGIYPIVIVTIIWFAHTVGYQFYTLRQERQKLNP